MNHKKKKMKLKKSVIFKGISFIVIFISLIILIKFIQLGVLPFKYLVLLILVLGGIDVALYFFLASKNYKARMIGTIASILLTIFFVIGMSYQDATLNFLNNITFLNIQEKNYQIYVLKDSPINSLNDISDKTLEYIKDNGSDKLIKEIKKVETPNFREGKDASSMIENLLNKKVSLIALEKAEAEIYHEIMSEFRDQAKLLTTIPIEVQKENIRKDVKLTKEPFSVYITGVDTYDGINTIARSDVNMIVI